MGKWQLEGVYKLRIYNYLGEELTKNIPDVADESYYVKGTTHINWKSEFGDENGFDTRNLEKNGQYFIEINLPQNTIIIRYGSESGRFTAPEGSEYEKLGLPYVKESIQFHKYRVRADSITVFCKVEKGKVAPIFNSPGGAIQYFHRDRSIGDLVKDKILERII